MTLRAMCLAAVLSACLAAPGARAQADGAWRRGRVVSALDGRPVAGAVVQPVDGGRAVVAGPAGEFALVVHRAGPLRVRVTAAGFQAWAGDLGAAAATQDIALTPTVYWDEGVSVVADAAAQAKRIAEPALTLEGPALRRELATTIAASLAAQPGVAVRSMGPAPARPVIRGLDGHRLLVLEDGASTGDLSATSPDHAVVVEPLVASRVDVLRGPAALTLGSNVIGGAVDVRREALPVDPVAAWAGQAGLRLGSVNDGIDGQLGAGGPLGPLRLKADVVARRGGDLRVPGRRLANTDGWGWDASGGAGLGGAWGHAAVAAGRVEAGYGIPGGFLGGHARGVDIELERTRVDGVLALDRPVRGLGALRFSSSTKSYYHRELESSGICGVAFGLVTHDVGVQARLDRDAPLPGAIVGLSGQYRDLDTACLSFVPRTQETSLGAYLWDQWQPGRFELEAALRWDRRRIAPAAVDSNKAGLIRTRRFDGVAAAASIAWPRDASHSFRGSLTRSFQPPAIEELFSEGPHLAAYSYEIGNAELEPERGLGWELEYRLDLDAARCTAAVFRYDVDGYVHAVDTGQTEWGPGEEGRLARYQYRGQDARLTGAEVSASWRLDERWQLGATASRVTGTVTEGDARALPRIPPLSGHVDLTWERPGWFARATVRP
ncbi:TonB-dependent receptor, partial [bacterium]|nr:TonB-dependent receptor [bacterium]